MELRFIVEHAEAEIATASKLFRSGDRTRSQNMLEDLARFLLERIEEGVTEPPNIDVKPAEPEQNLT